MTTHHVYCIEGQNPVHGTSTHSACLLMSPAPQLGLDLMLIDYSARNRNRPLDLLAYKIMFNCVIMIVDSEEKISNKLRR